MMFLCSSRVFPMDMKRFSRKVKWIHWYHLIGVLLLMSFCEKSDCEDIKEEFSTTQGLPTVTVRGFLNFKTTVDGTVIVFTPISEVRPPSTEPKIVTTSSEVFHSSIVPNDAVLQKNNFHPHKEMGGEIEDILFASPPQNSLGPLKTQIRNTNMLDDKMQDAILPHISENAVLPSSYPANNEFDKHKKVTSSSNQFPIGLVTVLGGTSVNGIATTVHETKVIGTYIEGKYAQILQSTSHVVSDLLPTTPTMSYSTVDRSYSKISSSEYDSISISPSTSMDIVHLSSKHFSSILEIKSVEIPTVSISSMPKLISSVTEIAEIKSSTTETSITASKLSSEVLTSTTTAIVSVSHIISRSTPTLVVSEYSSSKATTEQKPSQILLQSSFHPVILSSAVNGRLPTESLETAKKSSFVRTKSWAPRPISSTVAPFSEDDNTVPTTLRNNRNNSTSRTRFLSPRRPSPSVKLNRFKVKLTLRQDSPEEDNVTDPTEEEDMEEDHKTDVEMETVTEPNFSYPIDPAKVVFQETTITSKVTLHVGRRKSIRILTITTSVPLTVHPTDIQQILASESSSSEEEETDPYHHVETRTFTTTERALKTSIVPVYDGKSTTYHKVTESFFIMKYITAYRTLPVGEVTILDPVFDEPELSITTLEAAANFPPSVIQSAPPEQFVAAETLQPSLTAPSTGMAHPQLSNPFLQLGHGLNNNPLAAVYLGLQQLNAQMTLYSTVTDTSTYVTTETFYSTKTVRFYDGRSNRLRTVSEPTSTRKQTITTTITSVQSYLNTQAIQQQQQLQHLIGATRMETQYSTITSTYTTVTTATSLSTRIYTLIYNGFSTKFRTVTSTSTYPTTVTVTSTTKVPIAPTQVPFVYPYSS